MVQQGTEDSRRHLRRTHQGLVAGAAAYASRRFEERQVNSLFGFQRVRSAERVIAISTLTSYG